MSGFKLLGNKSIERKQVTSGRPVNFKPFCDCRQCVCNDCPNVLQRLGITFSNETCYFNTKKIEKSSSINQSLIENSRVDLSIKQTPGVKSKSPHRVLILSPKTSQHTCLSQKSRLTSNIKKKVSSESYLSNK